MTHLDDATPRILALVQFLGEFRVNQERREVRLAVVGGLDAVQEDGADDATACTGAIVKGRTFQSGGGGSRYPSRYARFHPGSGPIS